MRNMLTKNKLCDTLVQLANQYREYREQGLAKTPADTVINQAKYEFAMELLEVLKQRTYIPKKSLERFTKTKDRILVVLQHNPDKAFTPKEIANVLNLKSTSISTHLANFRRKGIIASLGNGKWTIAVIQEKNDKI